MSPRPKTEIDDDMLPEYDFTGAVRGKYYKRYRQGTNVVLLDPDVAESFRDSASVNDALRLLVSVAEAKVSRRHESETTQPRTNNRLRPVVSRTKPGGSRRRAARPHRG
jgi:hypothetical protein